MCKKVWIVAKLNLKNMSAAYIITAIVVVGVLSNYIVDYFVVRSGFNASSDNSSISVAWTLWLLPALASVLISSRNFRRIMNLGGRRDNYLWGSLAVYAILAGAVSLIGMVITYAFDAPFISSGNFRRILTAPDVFGWMEHGPVVAFTQQFAFLFLFASVAHTLTAMQDKWYGWATDVAIVAVISVFTPIASLRPVLVWFFRLVLFEKAPEQIAVCMVLALLIYSLNKVIFARKAI